MGISGHGERSAECGTGTLPTEALSFIVWSVTTYQLLRIWHATLPVPRVTVMLLQGRKTSFTWLI